MRGVDNIPASTFPCLFHNCKHFRLCIICQIFIELLRQYPGIENDVFDASHLTYMSADTILPALSPTKLGEGDVIRVEFFIVRQGDLNVSAAWRMHYRLKSIVRLVKGFGWRH